MAGLASCVERCCRNRCVQCFVLGIRWVPVLFILAVVAWSYYAYVYELCIKSVQSTAEKGFYLIFYHIFLVVFLASYYRCAFAALGIVPKQFSVPEEISRQMEFSSQIQRRQLLDSISRDLPVLTRTYDGALRYCDKCRCIKPDRAHHCSICGQCVLKMDHHCPWVNTCVSFTNYKFFILFLGYALLYCLYVALTDLKYFIEFWTNSGIERDSFGKFHIMFLFFVAGMFAISVSVLFFYHLWLVAKNRSTLESFRPPIFVSGPDKNGFSLGVKGNFQEIFGNQKILWFLPCSSSLGDGCTFPSRHPPLLVPSAQSITPPSSASNRPPPPGQSRRSSGYGSVTGNAHYLGPSAQTNGGYGMAPLGAPQVDEHHFKQPRGLGSGNQFGGISNSGVDSMSSQARQLTGSDPELGKYLSEVEGNNEGYNYNKATENCNIAIIDIDDGVTEVSEYDNSPTKFNLKGIPVSHNDSYVGMAGNRSEDDKTDKSLGNGVVYPIRTYDMECNSLLGGEDGSLLALDNRWSVSSDSEGGQSDLDLSRVPNGYSSSNAHHHAVIVR